MELLVLLATNVFQPTVLMVSVAIVLVAEILVKHVANTLVLAKGIADMSIPILKIQMKNVEPLVAMLEIVTVQVTPADIIIQENETVLLPAKPARGPLPAAASVWLTIPKMQRVQISVIQPARNAVQVSVVTKRVHKIYSANALIVNAILVTAMVQVPVATRLIHKIYIATAERLVVILATVLVAATPADITLQENETVPLPAKPARGPLPAAASVWLTTLKILRAQISVIQPARNAVQVPAAIRLYQKTYLTNALQQPVLL